MTDYTELIKALRDNGRESCKWCKFYDGESCCLDGECTTKCMWQAADAIDELSKPRWISVTERLPEKNGYYLTYVESALFPDSYYQNLLKFIDGDFIEDHVVIHRVTHWMPLPQPPKEET